MRKQICTASLFLLVLGLLVAACFVRLPDYLGLMSSRSDASLPVPLWLYGYVLIPLVALGATYWALGRLWKFCSWLCEKLQGTAG